MEIKLGNTKRHVAWHLVYNFKSTHTPFYHLSSNPSFSTSRSQRELWLPWTPAQGLLACWLAGACAQTLFRYESLHMPALAGEGMPLGASRMGTLGRRLSQANQGTRVARALLPTHKCQVIVKTWWPWTKSSLKNHFLDLHGFKQLNHDSSY